MTKEFKDAIPQLNIEVLKNGCIRLANESIDDSYVVDLHPVHLRHIAEKMGLIATSDTQALKTIATLQRRMQALRDRIESLADWMAQHSDYKHADLSHETTQLNAMADLAREWCHDFDEPEQGAYIATPTTNSERPPKCTPALADQAELL